MTGLRRQRLVAGGLSVAVILAVAAWVAGQSIKSPAQVAAETAAPTPSPITVPVERRTLSSEVIVRGTVRYGSPKPVELSTSGIKTAASGGSSGGDILTRRPQRGATVGEGSAVMTVSGRPVFVMQGAQPSHRDLVVGARGPDVRQLERGLARLGHSPGNADGVYDGNTAAAVAAFYDQRGYQPFGPTDAQRAELRAARSTAATARDAYLQSLVAVQTAAKGPATPGDIAQARIDAETARAALATAEHDVAAQSRAANLAAENAKRDDAAAAADVATKQAAVNKAVNALAAAQTDLAGAPPSTPAPALATLQAAVREASDDVAVARENLTAAQAAVNSTRAAGRDAIARALADADRARRAVPSARRQVHLAEGRLRVLRAPGDAGLARRLSASAASEMNDTRAEVARVARRMDVAVPADEVLFFPALPLRVDAVRLRNGDTVSGRVMTVSSSRLAVDSSLAINDAKLVRVGAPVSIEERDLGIRTTGFVTAKAAQPGTNKVDPSRIYIEVTPDSAPAQLLGASVRLSIAVKSTGRAVLAVPTTALSVAPDGSSRLQVMRRGGRAQYVAVDPGLTANGLVEIRPIGARLEPEDLVVVGERGGSP